MPPDVICDIALASLHSSHTPTPRELKTIISLTLTCRLFNLVLSIAHNTDLYGHIFRLMFDVNAVGRRMGIDATKSSALASELIQRLRTMKAIKTGFDDAHCGHLIRDVNTLPISLNRIYPMMTEDEGKNRYQLFELAEECRIPDLFKRQASASGEGVGHTMQYPDASSLALFVTLLEMGSSHGKSFISMYKVINH